MKKLFALALILSVSSCANYERLTDKFKFKSDKDFDYVGANVSQKRGAPVQKKYQNLTGYEPKTPTLEDASAYEISVNAPAGSSIQSAISMFDSEAEKVCGSQNFKKQITSTGTDVIREFGMKKVEEIRVPQVKGIVTCM